MIYRKTIFLVVPLLLSDVVHLWNTTGFPTPTTDEGTYLGRAMNVLEGFGGQDPHYGYDHPYFGQLFMAAVFSIIGYPESFNIPNYANAQTFETLFLVPRTLTGILAVFDSLPRDLTILSSQVVGQFTIGSNFAKMISIKALPMQIRVITWR